MTGIVSHADAVGGLGPGRIQLGGLHEQTTSPFEKAGLHLACALLHGLLPTLGIAHVYVRIQSLNLRLHGLALLIHHIWLLGPKLCHDLASVGLDGRARVHFGFGLGPTLAQLAHDDAVLFALAADGAVAGLEMSGTAQNPSLAGHQHNQWRPPVTLAVFSLQTIAHAPRQGIL